MSDVIEENKKIKSFSNYEDLTQPAKSDDHKLNVYMNVFKNLAFVLDKHGAITDLNNSGAVLLDYQPEELKGKHFIELVSSKDKPIVSKAFQQLLSNHRFTSIEAHLLSKYGKQVIFELNGAALIENGSIVGVLGIGENITLLRSYEDQIHNLTVKLIEASRLIAIERNRSKYQKSFLDDLNRLKNEFISNISHELRTPLASIIGFSETILSDPNMSNEMRNEFNQIIFNEGKRLAKLIEDVLNVSKIEEGEMELGKSEFNIIELLKKIIKSNKENIEEKGIILTIDLPSEEIIVNADKMKLEQVYDGLLNNAIKFTDNGGRITVIAQNLFREFEVIISDTGSGIPKKDLPYIFEKFYKASTPGIELPGTGLGLALVKQIIDLHKGFIAVESEVNNGTTFIIKLPKGIKI